MKTTKYRGYTIVTKTNGNAKSSLIYKGPPIMGKEVGATFGIVGIEDSIEKAKIKIDGYEKSKNV